MLVTGFLVYGLTVLELICVLNSVALILNISGGATHLDYNYVNYAVLNCCAAHPLKISVACFWIAAKVQKMQVAELNIAPAPTTGLEMYGSKKLRGSACIPVIF